MQFGVCLLREDKSIYVIVEKCQQDLKVLTYYSIADTNMQGTF